MIRRQPVGTGQGAVPTAQRWRLATFGKIYVAGGESGRC
jgi:hypothetical protein